MLSGGQKQRLAIARALLIDSEILLLDDSLSAVDARTESRILHHIRKERAGKTTLIYDTPAICGQPCELDSRPG